MCRILLLLVFALLSSCASLPKPEFTPAQDSIKVVTYNVNWGAKRMEVVADFLQKENADVVFLQETHPEWEQYLKATTRDMYPYSYFHTSRGAGGIAFLSKRPLKEVRVIQPEAGWFPALTAEVDTRIGRVRLLNVHLRPPLSDKASVTASAYYKSPDIHRKELAGFMEKLDGSMPLIVAGDFNEHESKDGVGYLLSRGYKDALSQYDRSSKTWRWRVATGIEFSNRYDHIVYSPQLTCTGAKVTRTGASDHEPVSAVFTQ